MWLADGDPHLNMMSLTVRPTFNHVNTFLAFTGDLDHFTLSWLKLYFADIGRTGSIFPSSVRMQSYVWAGRGEAVGGQYRHSTCGCVTSGHELTRTLNSQTQELKHKHKQTLSQCLYALSATQRCIIQSVLLHVWFIRWGSGGECATQKHIPAKSHPHPDGAVNCRWNLFHLTDMQTQTRHITLPHKGTSPAP